MLSVAFPGIDFRPTRTLHLRNRPVPDSFMRALLPPLTLVLGLVLGLPLLAGCGNNIGRSEGYRQARGVAAPLGPM
jgi:hypothetical protein